MNTKSLKSLLYELESLWRNEKAPILDKLNPGLKNPEKEIYGFSGVLPNEVWELYSWKNGVNATSKDLIGNLKIFQMGIFLPLEKAIDIEKEMIGTEFGWDSNKFVLFESGGGDYYLIDGNTSANSYGMLFYHSIGSVEFETIISQYDSLYALFLTIYECFKRRIFTYDKGLLKIDREKYFDIGKEMNPRSDYWKLGSESK